MGRLGVRLAKEGRVLDGNYPHDWSKYNTDYVTFYPAQLASVDLVRGFDYAVRKRFGSRRLVWRQTLRTLRETRSVTAALFAHSCNKDSLCFYDFDGKFLKSAKNGVDSG